MFEGKIAVDTTGLQLAAAAKVARAVNEFNEDRNAPKVQDRDENGVPLWTIKVSATTEDGVSVGNVKFPSATEPNFKVGEPLKVEGLEVFVTTRKESFDVSRYFSARSVSSATLKREHSN